NFEAILNSLIKALYIIKRMLPKLLFTGITIRSILPPWIKKYRRGYLLAGVGVYNDGTNRIGPIIYSYDKAIFFHYLLRVKITINYQKHEKTSQKNERYRGLFEVIRVGD